MTNVGIAGIGIYLPNKKMSAQDIAQRTNGIWSEEAIIEKLGIVEKYVPGDNDGTQEMGARAAQNLIETEQIDPREIDVILCFGEEYKEYPLTTSALYIQDFIGATNAWGIDLQNRCCTTVTAMKIAKDMLIADENITTILVCGGYRNGDLIDYSDADSSMMFDLSAGGGAILLKKNHHQNLLLGSHIISDGSLARTAGVEIGGIANPITTENIERAKHSLKLMEPEKMKQRLNDVSMTNWYTCIDRALAASELTREEIDYLNILHMKRSGHLNMLKELNLAPEQSIYLENYGHLGQIDQILSLKLGLEAGKIKEGSVICSVAAGIGYVWAANIIRWGSQ